MEVPMTLGGILGFLYYHTMHHHATVAVLAGGLNHSLSNSSFGYNPSTLRYVESLESDGTSGDVAGSGGMGDNAAIS